MEERDSLVTPARPADPFSKTRPSTIDPIHSSSPAFATPAYPIASRPSRPGGRPAPAFQKPTIPAVLPILLPPTVLRPLAFRTISKKYNLTITSAALQSLAIFIGRYCGTGWREDGLAERVVDEVAKAWKRGSGGVIVDDTSDKKLADILKQLESCMSDGRIDTGRLSRSNSGFGGLGRESGPSVSSSSRKNGQISLGPLGNGIENDVLATISDGEESSALSKQDARSYLKVVSAFDQPRFTYSTSKQSFELITTPPSLFPPPSHRIALFRSRYSLIHQRLMRNESFQTSSFSTAGQSNRSRDRTLDRSNSSQTSVQQAYKITPIANLLGRSGSSHLLLGLLAVSPTTGELALTDLSGSITLDLSAARHVPEDGAWFCPGMMVLIEGAYEEDGSNTGGGVGGMIGGRFFGSSIGGPPAERREVTVGINTTASSKDGSSSLLSAGAGFGWTDFLGMGSERAQGNTMRRLQRRILGSRRNHVEDNDDDGEEREQQHRARSKIAIVGECQLDNPRTLEAIRKILATYTTSTTATEPTSSYPLSIVLMGNFTSKASLAGYNPNSDAGSIEYKEHFDSLASVLSEFPSLLSSTSLIFVPGDNDPWPSAFSAGAATPVPRDKVPDLFTSRVRRVFREANNNATGTDSGKTTRGGGGGEAVWTSNPARISVFGPVEDIVLFRDDMTGRLRRSAVTSDHQSADGDGDDDDNDGEGEVEGRKHSRQGDDHMDLDAPDLPNEEDSAIHAAESHLPNPHTTADKIKPQAQPRPSDRSARKLIKTIVDQSHLSPFPLSSRPILWDYASTLSLYPLPTALVLADSEAAAFAITYEGCCVLNPGRVVGGEDVGLAKGGGGGVEVRWVEYDLRSRRGAVKRLRL